MSRILLRCVSLVALVGGPALAADMPVKYKAPPLPPPTWTGFYMGINGGYGWRDNEQPVFTANDPYSVALLTGQNFAAGGGGAPLAIPADRLQGGFGGFQAGYNWQVNPNLLVGVEADIQGSAIRGTGTATSLATPAPLIATTTTEQELRWFGTVRGRLGFLPTDNWLVYGTGGFAYGQIERSVNVGFSGNGAGVLVATQGFSSICVVPANPSSANCFVGASSRTSAGWTAGAGTEWRLAPNITLKAEYLYMRLGGDSFNVVTQVPLAGNAPSSFGASWGTSSFNAVRLGLNYRFGDPPIVAKY